MATTGQPMAKRKAQLPMFTNFTIRSMNYFDEKRREETGEVASWLILAAGLAAAAVLASKELRGIIGALVDKVGEAAEVDSGG